MYDWLYARVPQVHILILANLALRTPEPPAAVEAGNVYLRPLAVAVVLLRKLQARVILFRNVLA